MKYGGLKFLEAAHVKDMMSVLRWADNPRNSVAGIPGAEAAARHRARPLPSRRSIISRPRASASRAWPASSAPQPVKMDWKRFCALFEKLADPATPWPGQVGLVREWYKPQLERIYDCRLDAHGRSRAAGTAVGAASEPRALPDRTDPRSAGR